MPHAFPRRNPIEKSLVLVLPDRPGALLEVMRIVSGFEVNVLRANYNCVTDTHTVVIDVSGTMRTLQALEDRLHEQCMFPGEKSFGEHRLLHLVTKDRVSATTAALAVVADLGINVRQFDIVCDESGTWDIRIGMRVEGPDRLAELVARVSAI